MCLSTNKGSVPETAKEQIKVYKVLCMGDNGKYYSPFQSAE